MVKDKEVENKREVMSFSVPADIACHIRTKPNMSAYIRMLVENDINKKEQQGLLEQIKAMLLEGKSKEETLDIKLDTLSALNSIID